MSFISRVFVPALSLGVALATAPTTASAQTIEQGPVAYPANGHSYYLVRGGGVIAMRTLAHSLGGELVTANTLAELEWLHATFAASRPVGTAFYLGLTDDFNEGDFIWMNGEPARFTFWNPGEPNDAGKGEDYTVFLTGQTRWDDRDASSGEYAIVEVEHNGPCIGAREIAVPGSAIDTLHNAVAGSTPCGLHAGPKVWFTFLGAGRTVTVSTCHGETSNFDTVVAAFRGDCSNLACIEQNDDAGCGFLNLGSAVSFYAEPGERYFVAVMDLANGTGSGYAFELTIEEDTSITPTFDTDAIFNTSNSHFYYRTTAGTWNDQYALARSIEGHLATMNDDAENTWVTQAVMGAVPTAFIGFTDRAIEGAFVWASGETPAYTNWAPGEPNNSGNEDVTELVRASRRWNDVPAAIALPAVIEVTNDSCYGATPLDTPYSVFDTFTPGPRGVGEFASCADPFVHGRGIWYRVTGNNDVITADTCGAFTDYDTSLRVFTGDCSDLRCVAGNDDGCGDGNNKSRVSFYAESGRTYFIVVGSFRDEFWGGLYNLTVTSAPTTAPTFTARSAVNIDDCSRSYAISSANFLQAAAFARAHGMNLASVLTADDNEFIRNFAAGAGLGSAWIGLADLDTQNFAWLDGAPVGYTNWNAGEPNGGWSENFAEMIPGGAWNDVPYSTTRPAVAETPIDAEIGAHIRGGLSFNSQHDAVNLPANAFAWPGVFTIECWFRTDGAGDGVIFGQQGASGAGFVPMISVGVDGHIRAAQWAGSVPASSVTGTFVADGAWRHVALVHLGSTMLLFVDGLIVANRPITPVGYDAGYTYSVGNGYSNGWPGHDGESPNTFNGDIDELRIWSTALSPAEIVARKDTRYFNPALYPNLVVHLDLDDAGGGLAFDDKSGRHGVLAGSPVWRYEDRNADKIPDACQPDCPADIDGNGAVNSTDVSEFINIWFADQAGGALNADFNRDGVSNSTDVSDMINAYFEASGECLS